MGTYHCHRLISVSFAGEQLQRVDIKMSEMALCENISITTVNSVCAESYPNERDCDVSTVSSTICIVTTANNSDRIKNCRHYINSYNNNFAGASSVSQKRILITSVPFRPLVKRPRHHKFKCGSVFIVQSFAHTHRISLSTRRPLTDRENWLKRSNDTFRRSSLRPLMLCYTDIILKYRSIGTLGITAVFQIVDLHETTVKAFGYL